MKQLTLNTLALACMAIAIASCKKEKENIIPTTRERVAGHWELDYQAVDTDNDGKIDENEKSYTDENSYTQSYTLLGDGTGSSYVAYKNGSQQMDYEIILKWALKNGDTELEMTMSNDMWPETYSNISKIETLTDTELLLQQEQTFVFTPGESRTIRSWMALKRK